MDQLFGQLVQYFQRYSIRQRIILMFVLVGFISSVIALVLWANRPEYELLYGNLEPEAASNIVSELRSSKIKFRLENGGTSIYVPRQYVGELRLKFAQYGSASSLVSGYEIFDKRNVGMTTFLEHLNLRRALEGELTRTINQFPEVKYSRVHLVIPERRLFAKEEKGSASVVLYLHPGVSLSQAQINGIASLVANSVEGIDADNVVILDSNGKVLSRKGGQDGLVTNVSNQWELRQAVESELRRKVTEIVESVVGYQNAIVQVSADLNFDRIERRVEKVDPDNVVVVSEERYTENSGGGTDSSNFNAERVISNYELSKTLEQYVADTGNLQRVSVAVLVNGKMETRVNEKGEKVTEYVPRTPEELEKIASLVKTAVGYSEERGDVVEVQNMPFDQQTFRSDQEYFDKMMKRELLEKIFTYVLIVIGLAMVFFIVKTLLKSSFAQLALPAIPGRPTANQLGGGNAASASLGEPEVEIPEDIYMKKLSPEARAQLKAKGKMTSEVIEFAKESPEDATKLLKAWLAQEKNQ